jgi:hypothetical protein
MGDVNVLVVFYCRSGGTEKLALAAGLGAIQARANIRLRRLADLADRTTIEASAEWKENLDRMSRDYVAPRPADPVWADEIERYCELLQTDGAIAGRIAAPMASGSDVALLRPIYAAAACAGLVVAPPPLEPAGDPLFAARTFGQRVTQMARALKPRASKI